MIMMNNDDENVMLSVVELPTADAGLEVGSSVGNGQHSRTEASRTNSTYRQLRGFTSRSGTNADCSLLAGISL